ncbi:MAG: carboxypeptidase regulatory-like domain-containing protein, partial [Longimicrobiales bacterium]
MREDRRRSRGWTDRPFVSRDPAELAREGFVESRDDGDFAYAPDAAVLLSDAFSDTHCFGVTPGDDGRVGLTFEPVPGRRVTDIRGDLWLDAATAELQSLDYRYENFPDVDASVELGGEVVFQRLPTGLWIVREWTMDLPIRGEVRRAGALDLFDYPVVAIQRVGGEVYRAVDARDRTLLSAARATLGGVVFDSIRGGPVEGARVVLVGTDRAATTEPDGSFLFSEVPEGRYTVSMEHARHDSLGLPAPTRSIELVSGAAAWATLSLPTRSTLPPDEGTRLHGEFVAGPAHPPVRSGLVEVVDRQDRLVQRLLTDTRGRYLVTALAPGEYRIRLRRAGHRTVETAWTEIAAGTAHFRSDPAAPDPIPRIDMEALRATGATCALAPGTDSSLGLVWA